MQFSVWQVSPFNFVFFDLICITLVISSCEKINYEHVYDVFSFYCFISHFFFYRKVNNRYICCVSLFFLFHPKFQDQIQIPIPIQFFHKTKITCSKILKSRMLLGRESLTCHKSSPRKILSARDITVEARGKALVDTDISMAVPAGTCEFTNYLFLLLLPKKKEKDREERAKISLSVSFRRPNCTTLRPGLQT